MNIVIKKDGNGFLAEVEGYDNIFAYGEIEEEAKKELLGVVEMMVNYKRLVFTNLFYKFLF